MRSKRKVSVAFMAGFMIILLFVSDMPAQVFSQSQSSAVWVWVYGYQSHKFQPWRDLGLNKDQILSRVRNISGYVGRNNLYLVPPVSDGGCCFIDPAKSAPLANWISALKVYSAHVLCRFPLTSANLTSDVKGHNIFTEAQLLLGTLGCDGMWLDFSGKYYDAVGKVKFNQMMQDLQDQYPNAIWGLNTVRNIPVPGANRTWVGQTWVFPSINYGTDNNFSLSLIQTAQAYYSNRVVLHWDASANSPTAPFSIFTSENVLTQESLVKGLLADGRAFGFSLLVPVIGSSTYRGGPYHGTLYNSFAVGTYGQNTFHTFVKCLVS